MELWQQIGTVLAVIVVIGSFLAWHFRSIHVLRDQIHDLEKKCESHATKDALKELELKMKDLEKNDALQQMTVNQFPDLLPLLKKLMESPSNSPRRKS